MPPKSKPKKTTKNSEKSKQKPCGCGHPHVLIKVTKKSTSK